MRLALFDLDQTLIQSDSEVGWCEFLTRRGLYDMSAIEGFMHSYEHGDFDFDEFMAFQLAPLTKLGDAQLEELREVFVEEVVLPTVSPSMHERLREHRTKGHTLLAVTAAHDFIARPICEAFDLDGGLYTQGERRDGRYTGRVQGTPCFAAGKILRVDAWLAERELGWVDVEESWFYSDSYNDLPLLQLVDHAVAVRPDDRLRAEAQARGWEIHEAQ